MWQNLERPPLSQDRLRRDLQGSRWQQVHVIGEVESTQLRARELRGDGDVVVIAEYQSAGRGRRDRSWVSPRQAGITMSLLFEDVVPSPWIGTMVSMAAITAVNSLTDAKARLKWPNDLILGEKKFGGVIAEVDGNAVIVGIGLNVSTKADELPVPTSTSLLLEGYLVDREPLVKAILRGIQYPLDEDLRDLYLQMLSTIGKDVVVTTAEQEFAGRAVDVDLDGNLILDSGISFSVGDVVHLR